MHIRLFSLMFLLFAAAVIPASASAQSIAVLGINSIEGDDDLARNLTDSLRASLTRQGCSVDERDISLMQMQLSVENDGGDCNQIDVECLDRIARHIDAGSLVFGIMHRVFTDVGQEVEVELHYYDRLERRIISHYQTRVSLTASQEALQAIADVAAPELIRCVRSADALDEDEDGTLPAATHGLSETSEHDLLIPPDRLVDAGFRTPQPASNEWVGWSLIGLGAALVLADIPVWIRINDLNSNSDLVDYRYRLAFGSGGDACSNASDGNILPVHGLNVTDAMQQVGRVRNVCSEGSSLEALQYVFLSLGLASAGTGAALLLSGVLVTPSVSADRATLTISGSF